jgi:glucose/arabinose dehydrogenase
MKPLLALVVLFFLSAFSDARQEPLPKPLVTGLKKPTSVAVGHGGKIYIAVVGESEKKNEGAILRIDNGKAVPFVNGLDRPFKIASHQQWLFVADNEQLLRIDATGKTTPFVTVKDFPPMPAKESVDSLMDFCIDQESGTMYVQGRRRLIDVCIFRVSAKGKVSLINTTKLDVSPLLFGMILDGASHLIYPRYAEKTGLGLQRINLADGTVEKLTDSLGIATACRMTWDHYGRLFISAHNQVLVMPRPGEKPIALARGFDEISDVCLDPFGKNILVVDHVAGTLTAIPIRIPGWEVDESPLPLETEVAFPNLEWTGWERETKSGQPNPLRPILLTHAGDGSGRTFVATQHGVIHAFPNDQKATKTTVFLDIQDRVTYDDRTNEEGFLGLAFHPKYKENGEFFVFYTTKKAKLTNVVSRFKVRKDDPNRADPASEEILMTFKKPFWNHDGGTILFGPDGYLYITHGDGGAANDPFDNGQKLSSLLGKVLRIDVNRKDQDKPYAIPQDNPFVGRSDALPEIWAYGLRNLWRMAFDPKTGKLWAGEVGQNLYEEINIIERGGNYGWNRRESFHPFGPKGTGVRKEFIEPIWEYHHDVGKSITGGHVYRGQAFPELQGHYLYADYVSGRIWALRYDEEKGRVTANRTIKDRNLPIMSFGEDDKGEAYLLTFSATGQGIYRIVRK